MGVDIGTYRCRIGTFRHGPGIDVVLMKLCVNYTSGIKAIGAVSFIGLLLIMAGVEMNPGPIDTPPGLIEIRREKKGHLNDMLEKFKLRSWFPSMIHLQDITAIDSNDQTSKEPLASLPWRFLKQIVLAKTTARDRIVFENFNPELESDDDDDEGDSEFDICPIDMLMVIFYCCDPMLKQVVCSKLFICRQAVPFMYDDPFNVNNSVLSLWPLRSIVVEWKNSQQSTESYILDQPTKIISFVRFGRPLFSKSKLQNDLLSVNNYDTFYNKDSPLGRSKRLLCQGYIEASWYLPKGHKNDMYDEFLTFWNVRGDLLNQFNQAQKNIVSLSSAVIVIIIDVLTLTINTEDVLNFLFIGGTHILVISKHESRETKDKKVIELMQAYKNRKGEELSVVYTSKKGTERNAADMEMIIRRELKKKLKTTKPVQCNNMLEHTSVSCITSDEEEEECKVGKQYAEGLISMIKASGAQEEWKQNITPLQHKYWIELSKMNKQLQRSFNKYEDAEKIKEEMKKLKERQSNVISEPLKQFIQIIVTKIVKRNTLFFFIEWLKIFLDDTSRALLPTLRANYNSEWQVLYDMKQNDTQEMELERQKKRVHAADTLISDASFGVEHLFREVGQIFELVTSTHNENIVSSLPSLQEMSKSMAKLISYGYPFEFLDGDASNIPTGWVESVLNAFQNIIGTKKYLTMSVLGIQSSGKSTLLNTMFGLTFAVSAGRCTRGVYIQMVKVLRSDAPFDYIIVIDSEGLRAPELQDQKKDRDNELATFVIGLGDFTLLNIKGENASEINDVLEITIHAFLRLKTVNRNLELKQKCIFVHQNFPAVNATVKMKYGLQKVVERLDRMTKEAALSENIENVTTFNQVIEFDVSKHVWYIPDLWQGDPPMAAINKGYSEKVEDLRSSIMEMAVIEKHKSYKCLPDIVLHATALWKGILSEDFVFSFRNSLEIKAYLQMESKYKPLAWQLECFVTHEVQSDTRSALKKCSTDKEVDIKAKKLQLKVMKNVYKAGKEIHSRMESFFEPKQNEYEDIVIKWKFDRLNSLKELTEHLVKSSKKEIGYLSHERKVQILTSSRNNKHIERLNMESFQLAQELKVKSMTQQEQNDRFETIWQTFVANVEEETDSDVQSTRIIFINTLIQTIWNTDKALMMSEIEHYNNLKIKLYLRKLDGSFNKMDITEDHVSLKTSWGWRGKQKTSMEVIVHHVNLFFCNIDEKIQQYLSKDGELKEQEIKAILMRTQDWFEEHKDTKSLGFTLKSSFKVRLYVFISCHISDIFEQHNVTYIEKHGTKAKMQIYRDRVRTMFDDCLKDRKAEATVATLLGHEIKDFVNILAIQKLHSKVVEYFISSMPVIKYHMIVEILDDLAEKNEFDLFMQYIHSPEQCAESWISKKCKKIIFNKAKIYQKLALIEITKLLDEIKHAIAIASGVCQTKQLNLKAWVVNFTKNLSECQMEIERFKSIERYEVVNFGNLETNLKEQIENIQQYLIYTFNAVDADSVRWSTNPYIKVSNILWGCKHKCEFCGEPCSKGNEHTGVDHTSIQHRPSGVKGIHKEDSKNICLTSCNFDIQSNQTHRCGVFNYACNKDKKECALKIHDYKIYRKYIPDWDIEPCGNMDDTSKYWMWVMASHRESFKRHYGIVVSNIPTSWNEITKTEAIKSIHKFK